MAPLEKVLDSRSREYMELCNTVPVSDERHTVYMRLYAACRRLSDAVKQRDAASAVMEIASNLMACEEVAILQVTANHNELSVLDSVGLSERQRHALESHAARCPQNAGENARWIRGCHRDRPHRGVRIRTPHEPFLTFAALTGNQALIA